MDAVWRWGLEIIVAIQTIRGPLLDAFFKAVTAMGDEEFFLILLPLMLWCVDFVIGARLAVVFLLASFFNDGLKTLIAHPRPFELDRAVWFYKAEGYGLPSGHAQMAVVVWGVLASEIRERWAWITAVVLMGLIGFSRVYLGVHFPTDVLAGWAVGGVLLLAYVRWGDMVENWITSLGAIRQILLIVVVSLGLLLLTATAITTSVLGVLMGASIGLVLLDRWGGYRADGPVWQRGVRLVIGGVVLFALRVGLKALFPDMAAPLYFAMRTVRYAVLGLWTGLGAPLLFQVLHIAPADEASDGV